MANSGYDFFMGILDTDGRPWLANEKQPGLNIYTKFIELLLKSALISQDTLRLPHGYLLDNPAIVRLFSKYRGTDLESRAFRACMADLLRVELSWQDHPGPITDWKALYERWCTGGSSSRPGMVYPNLLPDSSARQVANSTSFDEVVRLYSNYHYGGELPFLEYLEILNSTNLKGQTKISFNLMAPLAREIQDRKRFMATHSLDLKWLESISAATEQAQRRGSRLSRTLFRSMNQWTEAGLPQSLFPDESEYALNIAPVLGYFHQSAFAESLGIQNLYCRHRPSATTSLNPTSLALIGRCEDEIPQVLLKLDRISFIRLAEVRIGSKSAQFRQSLQYLRDSSQSSSPDATLDAINQHRKVVVSILSDFKETIRSGGTGSWLSVLSRTNEQKLNSSNLIFACVLALFDLVPQAAAVRHARAYFSESADVLAKNQSVSKRS